MSPYAEITNRTKELTKCLRTSGNGQDMRAPCDSLKKRKREEKYLSFFPLSREPMPTFWQCLVIFIVSSEDLRLEKFLKLNRDLEEKLHVLNQQFDGARVGVEPKKSDLEVRAWNDSYPIVNNQSCHLWMGIGSSVKNPTQGLTSTCLFYPHSFIDSLWSSGCYGSKCSWHHETLQQMLVKSYKRNLSYRSAGSYSYDRNRETDSWVLCYPAALKAWIHKIALSICMGS